MPTVTNTIKYPNGTVAAGRVTIDLVGENGRPLTDGAFVTAGDYAIEASYGADLVAGVWSVNLVANSLINPAGTAYRVQESVDGKVTTYYIDVPDGAGPYVAEDRLVDAPAAIASSALSNHLTDTDDAHDASAVSYAGSTDLVATTVEAALDELDADKAPRSSVRVLVFDGTARNVYHGPFWTAGAPVAGACLWEAWLRFDASHTGYWASGGYGGQHLLLAGFSGFSPSGNMYNGTSIISYTGDYTAEVGEWMHYAVYWDGSAKLWVLINGVPVGSVALTARQADQSGLFIGGSDHNNLLGAIAQVRGFEGGVPVGIDGSIGYTPERHFSHRWHSALADAAFLADYTTGAAIVADLSAGYGGTVHPGKYGSGDQANVFVPSQIPEFEYDNTAPFGPQFVTTPAAFKSAPSARSAPTGARIFDSFSRLDQLPVWTPTPDIGSTEGGSLGALAWQEGGLANWMIQSGWCVGHDSTAIARCMYVENGQADMDVRAERRVSSTVTTSPSSDRSRRLEGAALSAKGTELSA